MNIEPGFGKDATSAGPLLDELDESQLQRRKRLAIIVVAGLTLLFVAVTLFRALTAEKPADEAPPSVTVIVPGTSEVTRLISTTGTLAAKREMPVGVAGEGGMIARVMVEPGDWVGAGQSLAVIDASVQIQQANQLRAQIAAARADLALAETELQRSLTLVGRGFVSQADVDRKTATRDGARARVALAQAQLAETQAQIGRLAIRSPDAGLVLTRAVEPGQVVGPGNGALFRVAKGGEMELRAKLSDSDLAELKVGDLADVVPVGTRQHFTGRIWQLAPVVDPQSRQGEARIQIAYDKALRPGGFASAEIKSGTMRVPLLPESAVQNDDKGHYVYIIGPDNKATRRDVSVGAVSDTGLPIISGLSGNEKVVLSAGAFLSPGDPVIPVFQKPARK